MKHTTTEELFRIFDETVKACRDILEKKNHDYGGAQNDALKTFRSVQSPNLSPPKGICVRISDKLSRVASFIDKGVLRVDDESVEDTINDLINYAILLKACIWEEKSLVSTAVNSPSTGAVSLESL